MGERGGYLCTDPVGAGPDRPPEPEPNPDASKSPEPPSHEGSVVGRTPTEVSGGPCNPSLTPASGADGGVEAADVGVEDADAIAPGATSARGGASCPAWQPAIARMNVAPCAQVIGVLMRISERDA